MIIIYTIGGVAIIGLAYGIYKMKASEEAARKRAEDSKELNSNLQIKWDFQVKQKALDVKNVCESNMALNKPLVSTTFQASTQMKDITKELSKVAELKGKIDSITEDLVKKGGVQ